METAAQFIEFAELNKNAKRIRQEMDTVWAGRGLDKGTWTVNDLADYLCFKTHAKHLTELSAEPTPQAQQPIQEVTPPQNTPVTMSQDVQARYARYSAQFIPETPNDESLLWQLCQNEVTLERLNDRKNQLIETRAKAADVKSIVEAITKLSTDNRAIQTTLGIDRPSRGTGQDAGDKLMEYIHKAKAVLHRQSLPIVCIKCMRSDAKALNLYGFIVWHLQDESSIDFKIQFKCPRCGTELSYTRENVADLKGLVGW